VLDTNEPQVAGCEKFEPQSEVIYLPARTWTDLPPPEAAHETQELNQPDAPPASTEEEKTIASSHEGEGYNSPDSSFWNFGENRIYTWVYTYTPGFSGIHPSRPRHRPDFQSHFKPKHDTRHSVPRFRQAGPRNLIPDFRKNSVHGEVPTTRHESTISPPTAAPRQFRERLGRGQAPTRLEAVLPNVSRQSPGTPAGAGTQTPRSESPRVSQRR
jgi:hypothetical protein